MPNQSVKHLKMVIAPASNHTEGVDFKGLVRFLTDSIGIRIELIYCENYGDTIAALKNGDAEIGWLGHYAYLEAAKDGDIEPIAVSVSKGAESPSYQSLFIARADSSFTELKDVKNSRIAIGDQYSTSGYIVPKSELEKVGVHLDNANEFPQIVRAHDHDEAIQMVWKGEVDVAPVSSLNFKENIESQSISEDEFKVIHASPDIPGGPLVCAKSLSPDLKKSIKKHILEAHHHIQVGGYGGQVEKYLDPSESRREYLESRLRPQWGWKVYSSLLAFCALIALIVRDLEIDFIDALGNASSYLLDILNRMLPPDFSRGWEFLLAMVETIEIAVLGTLLAISLSIPLGFLSARNVSPNRGIYLMVRIIVVFFRAIPEFIMAMILVIAIGFGALPGVIALGLHTMGFLAKFYGEAIEHVRRAPIEALESTGASKTQTIMFAIVPQIIPSFVANNLYILDRNVRMATMLGIVGAGGIGYELQSSFRMFRYHEVSAVIIIIFGAIFAIDLLSSYIRSKIT